MIPIVELRRIMASGFAPLSCDCSVNSEGFLIIRVFEPKSGRVELLLNGVAPEGLDNMRTISNLIGELRTEMKAGRRGFAAFG
ncbi:MULTISPECIES: DUF1652 domain-containing protein [unclassified Pseudomonas]|uniref:DUF1652 domain-containing protein n=1 Tax=unclassified Pseudomonas TaxID=196821 RepID=UPI001475B9E4|nr:MULTISPECIES: DUF1652 domain-containing protein [unclassified Pseudomonas]NMX90964.1 DUF1652 domain-containing protein [Pseudomonas sp. WS 5086]NMY45432.1 DUF1652 domain-containing protein [Pseudomonas sp. WS 5027]